MVSAKIILDEKLSRLLTVTKNTMKLVLGKERQPINTVLLVLAEFGIDFGRNVVLLYFTTIQELSEELSLAFTTLEHFFGEAWRIR
jgi:hypothetical protein